MTDQELLQAIGQVVESKIEPLRKDICEVKDRVGRLEVRMDRLEARMDSLETRMDRLEARVDKLEVSIDQLETRVGKLEISIDQLETRVGKLEVSIDKLETEVHTLQAAHTALEDKVNGICIYMETEQKRTLNLLLEGQQALWDRFVPREEFGPLEDRTEVLELTVKRHSQEIRELQFA